jgi:hypothetical protein
MSTHANHLGQPIGFPVSDWQPRPRPPRSAIDGRFCRLEPFDAERHAADLFAAYSEDAQGRIWTYLPNGPFASFELFRKLMQGHFSGEDPLCHVILDRASGRAAGMASYMRRRRARSRSGRSPMRRGCKGAARRPRPCI